MKTISYQESAKTPTVFFSILNVKNLMTLAALVAAVFAASVSRTDAATVNNTNDSGAGSLRAAIAGASVGETITITASGTLNLQSPLPPVTAANVSIIHDVSGGARFEINGAATRASATPSYGLDIAAPNIVVRGLTINRFGEAGIHVGASGANAIIVQNIVGANADGTSIYCPDAANPCGNVNRGIWVEGATGVKIGTSGVSDIFNPHNGLPNMVAGNLGRGIVVSGAVSGGTTTGSASIQNNFVGTDFSGTASGFGNFQEGILIASSSNNLIGGTSALSNDSNFIIGNGSHGIAIVADTNAPASNNTIVGNYIGIKQGSGGIVPNNGSGIVVRGANNTIGGADANARNIISGNQQNGISISTSFAVGNTVQGNYIGTDQLGGGTTFGNYDSGILISGKASGNTIGCAVNAVSCAAGVGNLITANGNVSLVGGVEPASFTARSGIYVDGTSYNGNTIRANSVYQNGNVPSGSTKPNGLGIDLGENIPSTTTSLSSGGGRTANDAMDADNNPNTTYEKTANNLQNFPIISGAYASTQLITGSINSTPGTIFVIDFYRNEATDADPLNGVTSEGRFYLGSVTTLATDASGNAGFSFTAPLASLTVGQLVTATATSKSNVGFAPQASSVGDTSEFSDATVVSLTAPTAATANISGRIVKPNGAGLPGVNVQLISAATGETFYATTDVKGNYYFTDRPTGHDYIITAQRLNYVFAPSSRFFSLFEDLSDVTFTASPSRKGR